VGQEADLVVVNLASTPVIEQATRRAEDIWQAIFPTIMLGDDRAIQAVWALGKLIL
jgi:guanine deaminase